MTMHRYEARADIVPGKCEHGVGGRPIQLVTLTMTDAGPVTMPDGTDIQRPDVICPLRTSEARSLGALLLQLADQAQATR
ncbi:MAG: hypothetical protein ACR2LK_09510 [Solirubrobacteraceae bacterium]|jgi:hypothetical protein